MSLKLKWTESVAAFSLSGMGCFLCRQIGKLGAGILQNRGLEVVLECRDGTGVLFESAFEMFYCLVKRFTAVCCLR